MLLKEELEGKIKRYFEPTRLEILNESDMHNVPSGSESHFKVVVVSKKFEGKSFVERHQMIYQLLAQELKEKIHALSLQTFTPQEWLVKKGRVAKTPECLGGAKK